MNRKTLLQPLPSGKLPHWKQIFDQAGITTEVAAWPYDGSGTTEDPFLVEWIDNDPRNPMNYRPARRWAITTVIGWTAMAVSLVSSAYTGGADGITAELGCSEEVYTLGISLCVLGFAVGPLLWAPLSELFGRQSVFFFTYGAMTAFNAGSAGSQNIATLLVLRFLAGAAGSSALTNGGGVLTDMFPSSARGLAMTAYSVAPAFGPCLGPVVGGFVGQTVGWRWVLGVCAIFTGVMWILGFLIVPETYAPVLLRHRAKVLSSMTGKVYLSRSDASQRKTIAQVFKRSLSRPLVLLFMEPIVLLLSLYHAIIYGILYMLFAGYPYVYQEVRDWSPGIAGLAFLGVAVGIMFGSVYAFYENHRYAKVSEKQNGMVPPEARLPVCIIGAVAFPTGLFWFAWTNYTSINYMASISAGIPFGFGLLLIWLGIFNYLADTYTIYAASALAANTVLRSILGAVFPLFTPQMYENIGIHWASSVPAFISLACVPLPILFYRYGRVIRERCQYAAESVEVTRQLQRKEDQRESKTGEEA